MPGDRNMLFPVELNFLRTLTILDWNILPSLSIPLLERLEICHPPDPTADTLQSFDTSSFHNLHFLELRMDYATTAHIQSLFRAANSIVHLELRFPFRNGFRYQIPLQNVEILPQLKHLEILDNPPEHDYALLLDMLRQRHRNGALEIFELFYSLASFRTPISPALIAELGALAEGGLQVRVSSGSDRTLLDTRRQPSRVQSLPKSPALNYSAPKIGGFEWTRLGGSFTGPGSLRAVYGWLHHRSIHICLLVVFLAFVRARWSARPRTPFLPTLKPPSATSFAAKAKAWIPLMGGKPAPHTVPGLMDAAKTCFRAKLARQSTTLAAVVAEYKRRYARAPLREFSAWYAFAVQHAFIIINEFDAGVEDLTPFWELRLLNGEEMRGGRGWALCRVLI
ncbi:CAP10 domain-containing protein [Mycena venus]|uniref:CAP10 domain-containing protein n=1 Tax=Mycena venus TaxID=2733690 RepID=A0A8H7DAB4_9AGAR|nr:CAP10 domain-containing protein [Mycena venus]